MIFGRPNRRSVRESAETLQAIANVLECSVRDLLDKEMARVVLAPHITKNSDYAIHEWLPSLFDASVHAIQKVFGEKKYTPSAE